MTYKRVRKAGKSFVVDDSGKFVGCSFSSFVAKNNWGKDYAKEKREQLLSFIAARPNDAQFAIVMGNEIYLTEEGEKFVQTCNISLAKKRIVTPQTTDAVKKSNATLEVAQKHGMLVKEVVGNNGVPMQEVNLMKRTTEQLDSGSSDKKDYIERAEQWISDLASMSTQTNHPFSTKKPFINPYNADKRVFIDLYRQVNGVNEGYIVLGSTGTVNGIQSVLLNSGSAVVMGRKFGDNTELYIVAQKFDERAIEYVKYNLAQNVRCMTLQSLTDKLVREAKEYFEEGDACFKLREWTQRYASLFTPSSNTEGSSNNVLLFTSVAA